MTVDLQELQAWMTYQAIARAEVMQRYPTLFSDTNPVYEFIERPSSESEVIQVNQVQDADADELAVRKQEATKKVREKLEALMKRQEEAKASKLAEETGDLTLDRGFNPQVNHSDPYASDLALIAGQQYDLTEEQSEEKHERSVVLWKRGPMEQMKEDVTEALKVARLDDVTRKKKQEELEALFRRKAEMGGVKKEIEDGLAYEEFREEGVRDRGGNGGSTRQIVDVIGCGDEGSVLDLEAASCTEMIQWQGQHENVVVIEKGVECMDIAAE